MSTFSISQLLKTRILLLGIFFFLPFAECKSQLNFVAFPSPTERFNSYAQRLLIASLDSIMVTAYDGVYSTIDGGKTWTRFDRAGGFEGLARGNNGAVFIGDANGNVWRTFDWGITWSTLSYPPHGFVVWRICVDPRNGTIYATDFYGLSHKSTDNGNTWSEMSFKGIAFDLIVTRNGNILISDLYNDRVLQSSSEATAWDTIFSKRDFQPRCLFEAGNGDLYVGGSKGLCASRDGGATWTTLNGDSTLQLAGNAKGTIIAAFMADTLTVRDSTNGSWRRIVTGLSRVLVMDIELRDDGVALIALKTGGVAASTGNLSVWREIGLASGTGVSIGNRLIYALAARNEGSLFAGVAGKGVIKTPDGGSTWSFVNPALLPDTIRLPDGSKYISTDLSCNALVVDSSQNLFAAMNRGVYRLKANSTQWEPVLIDYSYHGLWRSKIAVGNQGDLYFMPIEGNMYRSTNSGDSWTLLSSASALRNRTSIAIDGQGFIYVGTDSLGLYRSTDHGGIWTKVLDGSIRSTAFNSTGNLFALVGGNALLEIGGDHIFRSTDKGNSWSSAVLWAPNYNFNGDIVYLDPQDKVYVDFRYWSSNDGSSWDDRGRGVDATPKSYATDKAGFLYVGTHNGLLYKSSQSTVMSLTIGGKAYNTKASKFYTSAKLGILKVDTLIVRNFRNEQIPFQFKSLNKFVINPTSGIVGPKDSLDVTISYNPTKLGTVSETAELRWPYGTHVFEINGSSDAKIWFYAPKKFGNIDGYDISDSLNFGDVPLHSIAQKKPALLYTSKVGNSAKIDSMRVESGQFVLSLPFQLPYIPEYGFANLFDVSITPNVAGPIIDSLLIYSNTEDPIIRIVLTARVVGSAVSITPSKIINLGSVRVGARKDTLITISNTGNQSITISGITSSSPVFTVSPAQLAIPVNESVKDTIRYSPTAAKSDTARITIFSNAWSSPDTIIVYANGELTGVLIELAAPTVYTLTQNFPNPFNPATNIRYGLPSQSSVRLVVYNVLGQVVADLVSAEQEAGWNHVVWNANVSSGLYFYRLEAVSVDDPTKRFVDVKKMLLLR